MSGWKGWLGWVGFGRSLQTFFSALTARVPRSCGERVRPIFSAVSSLRRKVVAGRTRRSISPSSCNVVRCVRRIAGVPALLSSRRGAGGWHGGAHLAALVWWRPWIRRPCRSLGGPRSVRKRPADVSRWTTAVRLNGVPALRSRRPGRIRAVRDCWRGDVEFRPFGSRGRWTVGDVGAALGAVEAVSVGAGVCRDQGIMGSRPEWMRRRPGRTSSSRWMRCAASWRGHVLGCARDFLLVGMGCCSTSGVSRGCGSWLGFSSPAWDASMWRSASRPFWRFLASGFVSSGRWLRPGSASLG